MSIKDHVGEGQTASFLYCDSANLWYETDSGLKFPIPLSDADGAAFQDRDKAIFFMRWIRKYLADTTPKATFAYYVGGYLWYQLDDGFQFPVHVNELNLPLLKAEVDATFFAKQIDRQRKFIEEAKQDSLLEELGVEEKIPDQLIEKMKSDAYGPENES